jgi:hypothetical protein
MQNCGDGKLALGTHCCGLAMASQQLAKKLGISMSYFQTFALKNIPCLILSVLQNPGHIAKNRKKKDLSPLSVFFKFYNLERFSLNKVM